MLRVNGNAGPETIGIANLNIFYDKTRTDKGLIEPQQDRIDSIAQTLGSLPISLDVVMLQEVHVGNGYHNGERLADILGLENQYWFPHNRKGEHLGVCGSKVEYAEDFDIGDNRKAILAIVGEIAFLGIHHRSGLKNGHLRTEQMSKVIDVAGKFDKAVISGDSNDHSRHESRQALRDAGFKSVYRMKGPLPFLPGVLPYTFPTKNYKEILLTPQQRRAVPFGFSIDILELKGFSRSEIVRVGTRMTEKSDHKTLYAELAPNN